MDQKQGDVNLGEISLKAHEELKDLSDKQKGLYFVQTFKSLRNLDPKVINN